MKIKALFLVVFSVLIALGAGRTVVGTFKSRERLRMLGVEVENLRREAVSLEKELTYRESEEFVEKEARDRLNMVKAGEKIVVLPENFKVLGERDRRREKGAAPAPVWRQWWVLFFGEH